MLKPVVVLSLFALLTFGSAIADAAPSKCPVINGTYEMTVERGGRTLKYPYVLFTKQNGNTYSYTINIEGTFQVADGIARPFKLGEVTGKIQLSCKDNTMLFESWEDGTGAYFRYKVTQLSNRKIEIESFSEEHNGIYFK